MSEDPTPYQSPWAKFRQYLRVKFDLTADQAAEEEVRASISNNVDFQGTNLWILIFAILVASIGLNVNSTAVIIGAMLISPLMGPIMGVGLALGVSNFELMKRSLKNLGLAAVAGLAASAIYFAISPISTAQSELLARTTPTIYDVLIAFFGGLAGIVAQTRKDRTSTVIPGVAIATALMPPLCTAGYGLATWNMSYFIGAFYLFFINAVFIAVGTYIIVRVLKYKKIAFVDPKKERQVKRYMACLVVITVVPSIILAYGIIQRTIFEANANHYITKVLNFPGSEIINSQVHYSSKGCKIEVMLVGEPVSEDAIKVAQNQLENYHLVDTELTVRQPSSADKGFDGHTLQSVLLNNTQLLEEKNKKIGELEELVSIYQRDTLPAADITHELEALWGGEIGKVSLSKAPLYSASERTTQDTLVLCYIVSPNAALITDADRTRITQWLEVRTKAKQVKLLIDEQKQ